MEGKDTMKPLTLLQLRAPGEGDEPPIRAENCPGIRAIYTADSVDEAVERARLLAREGYGAIGLCGDFGEAGARRIIEAAGAGADIHFVTPYRCRSIRPPQ